MKSYAYDIFGNATEVRMNGTLQASYLYDYNGSLYAHTETVTGETARYFEDEYGYAGYTLTFDSDGQQVAAIAEPSVELGSTTTEDIYDRLVSKALTAGDATVFTQNYTYASNGYYSSYEIAGESFSGGSAFAYTYNDLGYLTSVKENGTLKIRYTYDNLGQLTREDNAYAGKTYVYTYDNGGNILTKKTYAYTTGTLGTAQSTVNYGYGNSNWKDQLTSYNGTAITYDASGNPLNWRNASAMNWTGRQLDSMTLTNGTNVSFQYNSDGLRVSKTVGSDTVKYRWDGTTLLAEEHSDYTITFLYDDGTLIGFNYGGNNYYYGIDNLGVIHYVYNEAGTVVVTYTYDAWGNTISASGDSMLININPIRYKSYYYDSETGFFYLQSRYYDVLVGRFISADDVDNSGQSGSVLSYNLYAYCENNPINGSDCNGQSFVLSFLGYQAVKVLIIGAATLVLCSMLLDPNIVRGINDMVSTFGKAIRELCESLVDAVQSALEKAKKDKKTNKEEDHHIVAKAAKKAQDARNILMREDVGIKINSSLNRVLINYNLHRHLHTNAYYAAINALLKFVNRREYSYNNTRRGLDHARNVLKIASKKVS